MKVIIRLLPLVILCACSPSGPRESAQEESDLIAKLIGTWQPKGETNTLLIFMPDGKFVVETDSSAKVGTFFQATNVAGVLSTRLDDQVKTAKVLFITPDEFVATEPGERAKGEIFKRVKK